MHLNLQGLKDIAGPVIAFLCGTYFIYHCIQGEYGLLSMLRMKEALEVSHHTLRTAHAEKEALEQRVYLLRPDSLDLDILEERARAVLNFARSDEVILYEEEAVA